MDFGRNDEVTLHARDRKSFYRYGVSFAEKQTALLQESRRRQADQFGLPGRLQPHLHHAAVRCRSGQVDDLGYFALDCRQVRSFTNTNALNYVTALFL